MNTYQSHWGFHPVSKETSKKLRYLNHVYTKALHAAALWERWDRKAPQNQIEKRKIRDEKGNKVGIQIIGPWKEPDINPLFHEKYKKNTNFIKDGRYVTNKVELIYLEETKLGQLLRESAKVARTPMPSAEAVKPLRITEEEINRLYDLEMVKV